MDDRGNRFRPYDPWEDVKEEHERDEFGNLYHMKKGPLGIRKELWGCSTKIVETTSGAMKTIEKIDCMTDKVISSERKLRDIFSGEDDED